MGHILGKCGAGFDFARLAEEICAAIPGTKVKSTEDSTDRIARREEITRQLETLTSSHPVDSAGKAARRRGGRCEVEIPLGETSWLKGTLSETGVVLATEGDVSGDAIRPVLDILKRHPELKLHVSARS